VVAPTPLGPPQEFNFPPQRDARFRSNQVGEGKKNEDKVTLPAPPRCDRFRSPPPAIKTGTVAGRKGKKKGTGAQKQNQRRSVFGCALSLSPNLARATRQDRELGKEKKKEEEEWDETFTMVVAAEGQPCLVISLLRSNTVPCRAEGTDLGKKKEKKEKYSTSLQSRRSNPPPLSVSAVKAEKGKREGRKTGGRPPFNLPAHRSVPRP